LWCSSWNQYPFGFTYDKYSLTQKITYLDEFLDEAGLGDVAEDDMLWVGGQDSQLVGDALRIRKLLLLEVSLQVLHSLAPLDEFDVADRLKKELIARMNVTLHNFLEVLKELVGADLQLGSNGGSGGLVVLLDVDVDYVVGVELPGEGQVVGALRGRSEDKLTSLRVLK
jgi:hypothetical protein